MLKKEKEFLEKISLNGEKWKDVVGYEGIYMCSSLGRIFICSNIFTFPNGGKCEKGLKVKVFHIDGDGYLRTSLTKKHKSKTYGVHRIVAEAFIPNTNNYPCIDHINGIRNDNRVENLRWCTNKQNANFDLAKQNRSIAQKKSYINGRQITDYIKNRSENTRIELYAYDTNGNFVKKFDSASDASKFANGFLFGKLNKNIFYFKGFIFSKKQIDDFSMFPYKSATARKCVQKITKNGEIVKEYNSLSSAIVGEDTTKTKMRRLIKLGIEYKGFIFKYK